MLSVIIPVFNEQNTVEQIVEKVVSTDLSAFGVDKEVIVVDDGSTDTTREVLHKIRQNERGTDIIRVFFNRLNLGKGTTVRVGLMYARGDIILIQDADLEYDPADYPELIRPILSGQAQVVLGSRFKTRKYYTRYPKTHLIANFVLTAVTNLLYGAGITDESTCYKVATADVFRSLNLKCRGFEFCPEFVAKVRKKGIPIHEVPVRFNPRTWDEGKKIGWKDGWQVLKTLLYYRFFD
ncbi:MAG: glycosyltransferase family 2 protein [Elusimicrobia bacterium]|nr:glycosyltransferase family 2 protein [Elusimicrobiota bacterium]